MMTIDLRYKGIMDKETSDRFNRIAARAQNDFNDIIQSLHKIHSNNLDWWLSSPLSRNIFLSSLFHYCCCIILLRELTSEGQKDLTVLMDSSAATSVFRQYFKEQDIPIKIVYYVLLRERILRSLRPWRDFIVIPFSEFLWFILCHVIQKQQRKLPSSPIILFNTFVLPGFVSHDRYYSGLVDNLTEQERETIFFTPIWFGMRLRDIKPTLCKVRASERNFLLKENYLKLQDYVYAGMHFFRIRDLCKKNHSLFFSGIDIFPLVREEIKDAVGFAQGFRALLNYRFAFRLQKENVQLRLVVNWFENHAIDKGWNFGFRTFFPGIRTKGYQGSHVTNYYMCVCPIKTEVENAVIPNEIVVIGKGAIETVLKYYPSFPVSVAPAFRFQHLWKEGEYKKESDQYAILITLPIVLEDAIMILRIFSEIAASLEKNVQIWIKPHPTTSLDIVRAKLAIELSRNFQFIKGDFYYYLERADLLISSMSSVCLEALAKGIPVVIIGNNTGLTHNPIPLSIDSDIWRLCYSAKELIAAIRFYKDRTDEKVQEHKEEGKRIKENYFEPVTRNGTMRFLDLEESIVSR